MQLSTPLSLLRDPAFRHRVQARLADSSQQVSDGWLRQLLLHGYHLLPQDWIRSTGRILRPASKEILCFSRSWSCLVHLACHPLSGCTLPEEVEGCFMGGGEDKTTADHEIFWLLCVQVLEGMLEGASRLRPVLHVVGNLLATRCDYELLDHFCQELNVPLSLLCLAKQILESRSIKQVGVGLQRNLGSFQPCRVLVLRRPWCPAGADSQDQCLFQAPVRRGRSWQERILPQ